SWSCLACVYFLECGSHAGAAGSHAAAAATAGLFAGLAGSLFFPQPGASSQLAGLFVMLMSTQFLLHAAALDQLLEAAQSQSDRFFVMNTHPQAHSSSFQG